MIKQIVKNIVWGHKASSDKYIKYLRKVGIEIGEDVMIYAPTKTFIDVQYPWMISIGSHVRITEGVKILTHDYSWSVLKNMTGEILGASGKVKIGNNVFIGMNTIITRNVEIGNNVIIGAGSVVTSNCIDNSLYVGVPAKRIMSLDDYYQKRKKLQVSEAKELAVEYYRRYGKCPNENIFHEYFMLFSSTKSAKMNKVFDAKLELCSNKTDSISFMNENEPIYGDFSEFIADCLKMIVERKETYEN